jgi:hypothetical protein
MLSTRHGRSAILRLPAGVSEGQRFTLWPPPSPLRRLLLSNPIVWIQQMAAKKRAG